VKLGRLTAVLFRWIRYLPRYHYTNGQTYSHFPDIQVWIVPIESIEWFTEGQAFSKSYDLVIWLLPHSLPPSPVSKHDRRHTGRLRKRDNLLMGERGRGWTRSRIIRPQESMVFFISFNTLCFQIMFARRNKYRVGTVRMSWWACYQYGSSFPCKLFSGSGLGPIHCSPWQDCRSTRSFEHVCIRIKDPDSSVQREWLMSIIKYENVKLCVFLNIFRQIKRIREKNVERTFL